MPAKLTLEDFVRKSVAVHGGRFDYSMAEYTNNLTLITILCPDHGAFTQRASHHMSGHGCPGCKAAKTSARCIDDHQSFIDKAKAVHGDTYDYTAVQYKRSGAKVAITCKIHGEFLQSPNSHIGKKAGCPKCAGKSMTTGEFIERARGTHGDIYGYDNTEYALIKEAVTVTCKTHGDFQQTAEAHIIGHGCRQCWAESYASKGEREISEWVKSLGFDVQRNTRAAIGGRLEVDIYIPAINVGIEYNGCYWHSDRVEKNKRKHEFKHACANTNGVRLLTVWDYDWKHRQDIVKRQIAHALKVGHSQRISARACSIEQIPASEANALYEANHIQGACRGGVVHLGLKHSGTLVAAMTLSKGGARRGIVNDGEWELARYATAAIVRGGASRLFSAFIHQTGASTIWSFSDKQHFDGGIYAMLGFFNDGDLPADYKVIHPATLKVWHKSMWQRKSIPRRLAEIGSTETFDPQTDQRTEHQMHDIAKVLRIWDAGKTRWLWKAKQD